MSNTMQHSFGRILSGLVSFSRPIGRRRPNKRLKLAGGDRFRGSGVLCAGVHRPTRSELVRESGRAPRREREPLGGERTTVRQLPPILLASWLAIAGCSRAQTLV